MNPRHTLVRSPVHRQTLAASLVISLTCTLFLSSPTLATTFIVNPQGTGSFPTIQAAINAAASGDTVALEDGTYTGEGHRNIDYLGRSITVRSLSANPILCIIDCQGYLRGFYFRNNESPAAVLEGVTICHGGADNGAGIRLDGATAPTIRNCILLANDGVHGGGIQVNDGAHPTILSCEFTANTAEEEGGGIYATGTADLVVRDCRFSGNSALYGAGIEIRNSTGSQIAGCTFLSNDATYNGAGIRCGDATGVTISACTFAHNLAGNKGGGMFFVDHAQATVLACTLVENGGTSGGGGMGGYDHASVILQNTIIAYSTSGSAVYCGTGATVTAACCDLYLNAGGDWVGGVAGQGGLSGNLSLDPLFCDLGIGDFRLSEGSPCGPQYNPECGLIGAWPVGCEAPPGPQIYVVRPDGSGDFPTIQAAVSACRSGDMIELTDGVFEGPGNRDVNFLGHSITLRSQSRDPESCLVRCGGSNSAPHRAFRFPIAEGSGTLIEGIGFEEGYTAETGVGGAAGGAILCGAGAQPTFRRCRFAGNSSEGSGGAVAANGSAFEHCIFENNDAALNGGGVCTSGGGRFYGCTFRENHAGDGGGLSCTLGPLEIEECCWIGNSAGTNGGATQLSGTTATLLQTLFDSNVAGGAGGAVDVASDAAATVTVCRFAGNEAGGDGGAISSSGSLTVDRCTLEHNRSALGKGGGICAAGGAVGISGSLLVGNFAPQGGALAQEGGQGSLVSCTLDANRAGQGAGVWAGMSQVTLERTIIYQSTFGAAVHCHWGYAVHVECCDIFGNAGGDYAGCIDWLYGIYGNISADPLFCDADAGDYGLLEDSPCAPFSAPNPECDLIGALGVGCVLAAAPEEMSGLPLQVSLGRPCPSPFSESVHFVYAVPPDAAKEVRIRVFDAGGRLVRTVVNGGVTPGWHAARWDGRSDRGDPLESGVYYLRLDAGAGVARRQILLVR